MAKQRFVIGTIGGLAVIVVLLLKSVVLSVVIGILSLIALFELFCAVKLFKNNPMLAALGFIFGIAMAGIGVANALGSNIDANTSFMYTYLVILFVFMIITYPKTKFTTLAISFLATMYITMFMSHIIMIRNLHSGEALIWILFICAWVTDTFAYLMGRFFGKHKLIPCISPKKTVEGAIGGVAGCVIFMAIFGMICSFRGYNVNFINTIIIGVIGSIFAQVGDLVASCIKRERDIKDFGNILPGHGGILDRFDSIIFIAPIIYFMVDNFKVFI